MRKKTILIICAGLPYPPNDGVRTRVYNIARQLLKRFDLKIVSIVKDSGELLVLSEAQRMLNGSIMPVSVDYRFWKKLCRAAANIFEKKPLEYHYYYFDEVAKKIRQVLSGERVDFVQFERSFLSVYQREIPEAIPTVINLYDFEVPRHRRLISLAPIWKKPFLTWNLWRIRAFENDVFTKASCIFAISESEKKAIKAHMNVSQNKIDILTGGIDTEAFPVIKTLPKERNILFVGSGMTFNYDAIRYFYYEIFPLVRKALPDLKWYIVGKLERRRLDYLLPEPSIEFCPNVASVRPYYAKCRALVVPLRGGGGTRLKIFEAMSVGRAIVSTTIGCEGIEVTNGHNILIADDPHDFASAVGKLLVDDTVNDSVRQTAYEFVRRNYDWTNVCRPLNDYYLSDAP